MHVARQDGTAARPGPTAGHNPPAACADKSAVAEVATPAAIAQNRAHLELLAATNHLAQCSPEIADTDAAYEHMYVSDMEAVCAYSRRSTHPSAWGWQPAPPGIGDVTGLASAPDVVSAARQVVTTLPDLVGALSSPYRAQTAGLAPVANPLSTLSRLSPPTAVAIRDLDSVSRATMLLAALRWGDSVHRAAPAVATLGSCAWMGALSVPMRWVSHTAPATDPPQRERDWTREPIRLVHVNGAAIADHGDATSD
jgi:hypothetical protein